MSTSSFRTTLDTCTGAGSRPARRVDVFAGITGRRRPWSIEQKLAILAEAEGCDNLCALARRHDIRTSQIYTWRRELRYVTQAARSTSAVLADPMFVPVVTDIVTKASADGVAVEVEFGGNVVRIFQCANIAMAAAVIKALKAAR